VTQMVRTVCAHKTVKVWKNICNSNVKKVKARKG